MSVKDCVDPVISSLFDLSPAMVGGRESTLFKLLFDALMSVYLFASFRSLSASDKELALSRSKRDFLPKCLGEEFNEEGSFSDSVADTDVSMSPFWGEVGEGTLAWKFSIEWFL